MSMIMDVVDITPPALEPVSLARAKLFLRVEHDAEDHLITEMICSARLRVETYVGASLITRQRRIICGVTHAGDIVLNHHPIDSVDAVRFVKANGDIIPLEPAHYQLNLRARPARLFIQETAWAICPHHEICHAEIDVTAGYGAAEADIPAPFTQAILLLMAQAYEREAALSPDLPMMVQALLMPYRGLRL